MECGFLFCVRFACFEIYLHSSLRHEDFVTQDDENLGDSGYELVIDCFEPATLIATGVSVCVCAHRPRAPPEHFR